MKIWIFSAAFALALCSTAYGQNTRWNGLVVAPENRCSPYNRSDYRYPASVENRIVRSMGGKVFGPYTGTLFASTRQTDIEHIISLSEAHDSGMCNRSSTEKRRFASDLLNLTLASPSVNRNRKSGKDVSEWTPERNACWYAARTVKVRQVYNLTIDQAEMEAVRDILSDCSSDAMDMTVATSSSGGKGSNSKVSALQRWDDNRNGRITCAEARRHGIAPVRQGHPAYRHMNDRDSDGIVCE